MTSGPDYSSLAYVKRFPIDVLKIDRSFIMEITTNLVDAAITTAIIDMAHSLNVRVVAEGVETVEQLDFFVKRGCDEIQGYYFARPLPPDKIFENLLSGSNGFSSQPNPCLTYNTGFAPVASSSKNNSRALKIISGNR